MKNSIELIWKEGFLNEKNIVAPKINDLYNRRSIQLTEKIKRMYKANLIALLLMAIIFPLIYYFIDALWQGIASSVLLLLTGWYSIRQKRFIKSLDYGASSLDYLKAFSHELQDILLRGERVLRFSYPLYFLIGISTIWSAWRKGPLTSNLRQQFPDTVFVADVPLTALIVVALVTLLILYFSGRIYRFDIRLVYGRVLRKLNETIAEMEQLKQD